MAVISQKRLLDLKEAANYLSISRPKLYEWSLQGKIPSVRIDNKRLFDVLELDELSIGSSEKEHENATCECLQFIKK